MTMILEFKSKEKAMTSVINKDIMQLDTNVIWIYVTYLYPKGLAIAIPINIKTSNYFWLHHLYQSFFCTILKQMSTLLS